MNIPREPHFYKKELELKISCSYGPGRYDHTYEEEGRDYPYGYVRWTENRNMAAFVKLLATKSVDVRPLITRVFEIAEAEKAYDIVLGKTQERCIAILLEYPEPEEWRQTSLCTFFAWPDDHRNRLYRCRQFCAKIPNSLCEELRSPIHSGHDARDNGEKRG